MQRERLGTIGPSLLEVLGSLTDPLAALMVGGTP